MPDVIETGAPAPSPPADIDLMRDLGAIKSRQLGEEKKVFDETERRVDEDRAYMKNRMEATGLEVEKLRPWNYEEESAKRATNPLEDFGSIGSVFGLVASAFTRAPLESALNSSAAAMNALKAGREKDYERAYTSWKDNMALVEKREKMIQDGFNDAAALMRTDVTAGTVKAQNLAARFGDEQSLFLLNNGMNKEFFELQEKRALATERMAKARDATTESVFRRQVYEGLVGNLPPEKQNDPMTKMRAWNYAHGMNSKTEEDVMMQWWTDHPDGSAEEAAKFASKYRADQHAASSVVTPDRMDAREIERRTKQYVGEGLPENEAYDKAASEVRKIATQHKVTADQEFIRRFHEEHPDATDEEFSKAFGEFKKGQKAPGGAGGNTSLTGDRQRAQDVAKYRENLRASTDPETGEKYTDEKVGELAAKYEAKLKATATPASGNQRDALRSMIDRTKYFESNIDNVENLLVKHNALAGLGGKVTRPAEVIGNVFGSNETDRKQFERWIAEMQEWAPRILNESKGRPLASEAAKVNSIVAGLSMGDTTANTVRAYRELRPLIARIREDLAKREGGTWTPPAGSGAPSGAPKPRWMDAPIIEKRSDAAPQKNAVEYNPMDDTA